METVFVKYVWIKVVPATAIGAHADDGNLLDSRVVPHTISGADTFLTIESGVAALENTTGFSDTPVGFFRHGMPDDCTESDARNWINSTPGVEWREGAIAWVLLYSFARVIAS